MKHTAIFLSAGVPGRPDEIERWRPNVLAIREAVLALVAVVTPQWPLVFGGHPYLSPVVEHAARSLHTAHNVFIFQSAWFADVIPPEAKAFENFHLIPAGIDLADSLRKMRDAMLVSQSFTAGFFVGGKEGILDEYNLFRKQWPQALRFPVASTGGAARQLWEEGASPDDSTTRDLLLNSNRYRALFRKLLQVNASRN